MFNLAVLFFCLLSLKSFAQKAEEVDYEVVPSKQIIFENSSTYHRINQKYEIGALFPAMGPGPFMTTGLYGNYRIDRNSSLIFEAAVGNRPFNYIWMSNSTYDVEQKSFGLYYKRFIGNTFYWRLGTDYRTVSYSHKYHSEFSTTLDNNSDFKGYAVMGTFQIGNQWQWENVTLGCDWVGYSLPLSTKVSEENISAGNPADLENERKNLKENQDILLKKSDPTALRLYLGWAF